MVETELHARLWFSVVANCCR